MSFFKRKSTFTSIRHLTGIIGMVVVISAHLHKEHSLFHAHV